MKEPIRLCDGDELPSALRDAFRELTREVPSAEMVARVQHTLQALPAAAPGAVAVSALSTGKLIVLSTLLAGTVASFVALRGEPASLPATPPRRAVAATERAAPGDTPAPGSAVSEASPAQAAPEPAAVARDPIPSPQHEQKREARAGTRPQRLVANAASRSFAHASSRASKGGSASRPTPTSAPEPTAAPQDAAPADERAAAPRAPDPDTAGAQASEARLLAQAKRLAARDPDAALRQLEALAAQFPAGLFAQERELLAVQLHRQLGHTVIAEQLARQFQERYPRSLYRRALPP